MASAYPIPTPVTVSPIDVASNNLYMNNGTTTNNPVSFSRANSILVQQSDSFCNNTAVVTTKKTNLETCDGLNQQQQIYRTALEPPDIYIKREPCQVSEITTSNQQNQSMSTPLAAPTNVTCEVKVESLPQLQQIFIPSISTPNTSFQMHKQNENTPLSDNLIMLDVNDAGNYMMGVNDIRSLQKNTGSSTRTTTAASISTAVTTTTATVVNTVGNSNGIIPVGIAVARQRPHDNSQQQQMHIPTNPDVLNRLDLGMFVTDIVYKFVSDKYVLFQVDGIMVAQQQPSTLWQYPSELFNKFSPNTTCIVYSDKFIFIFISFDANMKLEF